MPNEPHYPARAGSRAERLMNQRLAETAPAEIPSETPRRAAQPVESSAPVRPAARARALNKRIRDALREQTSAVYGETSQAETSEETPVSIETSQPQRTSSNGDRPKSSGSSWEDLANEVAPAGATRRGLATAAQRGASLPNPHVEKPHPVWRAAPIAPAVIRGEQPRPSELLHAALQGEEKNHETHGAHYLVSRLATEYDASFGTLAERLEKIVGRGVFPTFSGARVEDLLFVDIETAGLSSAMPLFLVGALGFQEDARLNLFLARDYPEERALLAAFLELARGKTLVTFNGKSFDWPYIEGRARSHRLNVFTPHAHLDMLHHARRTWKHSLPNCKLQTLELYLCGRTRIDDVPGSQIPRTYHEFVATHAQNQTGAHLMAPILHHNALDILTLAELVCIAGEEL